MGDASAVDVLLDQLGWARETLTRTLDGLSEHDARRPLTASGTNLLGLVTHLTMSEAVYLGIVLGHPCAGHETRFDDPGFRNRDSLCVDADRSRQQVLDEYARVGAHADRTVRSTGLHAEALVPWWPRPTTTTLDLVVHVLTETARHTGHADILREHLVRGSVGREPAPDTGDDLDHWRRVAAAADAHATQRGGGSRPTAPLLPFVT